LPAEALAQLRLFGISEEFPGMSLSPAAPRRHLHTRTIACEGYERDDGMFDIEARIVDTKTYAIEEPYRGRREAGAHVHDMQLRMTLDRAMTVRDIEVATNDAPYPPCYGVAPAYKRLVGAKIGAGWRKAVGDAVGATKGCTHLRELLMPAATVAFQTLASWPREGEVATEKKPDTNPKRPYFIDGCRAWAADGEVVQKLFPLHYRPRAERAAGGS
jgi:hypothetical protein